jgi:hypothetical protein
MDRHGTREELIAELEDIAGGCVASDRLRQEAADAAEALRKGAVTVMAGHSSYSVRD